MAASSFKLEQAITNAVRNAVIDLFDTKKQSFYYCCLITTGEAHCPFLSAWSSEVLKEVSSLEGCSEHELKWSYADSPYCFYGDSYFDEVKELFSSRPEVSPENDEYEIRLHVMENALKNLDAEGIFGVGNARNSIYINVEVIPPDYTNTERAIRLNPEKSIEQWLIEAAEE